MVTKEHPAAQLAGPFAAIGLVGGGLSGSIAHQNDITTAFALVTAVTAAVLGACLTHHKRRHGLVTSTRLVFTSLLAGAINGALLLIPAAFPLGSVAGAMIGVCFAFPFIPAFALVMRWGEEVGVAREGSIVDRAHRRGPIAAAAVSIALGTLLVFVGGWRATGLSMLRTCAGLAAGVLVIVVGLDVFARMVARRAARMPHDASSATGLELGVGDDVVIERPPMGAPYRAASTLLRLCGGDPDVALSHLRAPLIRHALALVVTLFAVALHAVR